MRIILVNQYYAPDEAATAQMLGDLGAALAAAGHQVTAICCDRSYTDPARRYPARERIDGVEVDRVRAGALGRDSLLPRLTDYLVFMLGAARRLLFAPRPDVVIVLTTPPLISFLAIVIAPLRRFRVVFWSMDVYPDVAFELGVISPRSLAGRTVRALSRLTIRRADVVVALGETMAGRLRSEARRLEIVHNWADEAGIAPRRSKRRNGQFTLQYSGNLGLAHEFETLLRAARRLSAEAPNVRLTIAGVGPRLEEVQRAARGLPNVSIRPFSARADLADALAAGDVHLITLRPNMPGLLVPSKIYGILAAGRPTVYIGPPVGEVADILREGRCGTIVGNGDVDALLDAIAAYASDRERLESEGCRARELFERHFTKKRATDHFLKIVDDLAP